jgi:dTDP-4-dehydrorhamnose reductase
MIIGNGLIANSLKAIDNKSIVFIAAGVSDSQCTDISEFEREQKLVINIIENHPEKLIVFFSTYSILDKSMHGNPYVLHKLLLENIIINKNVKYLIARVSNVVGSGGNSRNLFPFLINCISEGNKFDLWRDSSRNIILIEDFVLLLDHVIRCELNTSSVKIFNIVNSNNFSVISIVEKIEKHLNRQARYNTIEKSSHSAVVDEYSRSRFNNVILDKENYLDRILNNLYPKDPK